MDAKAGWNASLWRCCEFLVPWDGSRGEECALDGSRLAASSHQHHDAGERLGGPVGRFTINQRKTSPGPPKWRFPHALKRSGSAHLSGESSPFFLADDLRALASSSGKGFDLGDVVTSAPQVIVTFKAAFRSCEVEGSQFQVQLLAQLSLRQGMVMHHRR